MTELSVLNSIIFFLLFSAVITVFFLSKVNAPYGRHARSGWGLSLSNKLAWLVMEIPSVAFFLYVYSMGKNRGLFVPLIFLCLWQFHYIYRTFIFPLRTQTKGKKMPLAVVLSGAFFNILNSYINARWISEFGEYTSDYIFSLPFILGSTIFVIGFLINYFSDVTLLRLRKPGESGYKIPQGGLFKYVSCPNYLGEGVEWIGWAIATYSFSGLTFAIFTIANLFPRALQNHKWYKGKFDDYPKNRKAVIPFVL
jgi:protein-S-isoprenylcysteine O-methyltransferase Ste14